MELLQQIFDMISKFVDFIPGQEWTMLTFIVAIVEVIFRLFKTAKPLSIAWMVAGIIRKVGAIFGLIAAGLEKIAVILDKVLPQKTVE